MAAGLHSSCVRQCCLGRAALPPAVGFPVLWVMLLGTVFRVVLFWLLLGLGRSGVKPASMGFCVQSDLLVSAFMAA